MSDSRNCSHDAEECDGLFDVMWLGILVGPVCVLGYLGNILCLRILYRARHQRNVTIVLLKALATADLLYLVLYSIMKLWPTLLPGLGILPYMHAYIWPIVSMLLSVTTWLMVVLTGHRYVVICHPLQTRHRSTLGRVRMQIGVVCVIAAVMDIPRFFELTVLHRSNTTSELYVKPTWLYYEYYYNLLYKNGLMLLYRKILPLAITIILTVRLLRALFEAKRVRSRLGTLPDEQRVAPHEQRITKVLLAVVFVFILCQMPGAVYPVLRMMSQHKDYCSVYYYLYTIADGLTVVNSSVNFLIYMSCSSEFRQGFYKLWCGKSSSGRCRPTGSRTLRHPRTHLTDLHNGNVVQSMV